MLEIQSQVIRKVNNKYKKGLYFDFTPTMLSLLSKVLKEIGKDAQKATEQFNSLDNVDIDDIINETSDISAEAIKKNILELDNEIRDRVKLITEQYAEEANLREILVKDLETQFADKYTKGRISTLATTETTKTYGKVSKAVFAKNGVLPVWKHTGKGETDRAAHRAASGQKMNEKRKKFFVGGEWVEHPGDGRPSNSINCHCILVKG